MARYTKTPKIFFTHGKTDDISVNHYGMQRCAPNNRYGPKTRPYYLIHYVVKGKGIFYCKGKEFNIKENDIFLIRPNEETIYTADAEDPWQYYFVAFSGADADNIIHRIDWKDGYVFTPKNGKSVCSIMKSLFMIKRNDMIGDCLVLSSVYKLFAELLAGGTKDCDAVQTADDTGVSDERMILNKAKQYIEESLADVISVDELAKKVGFHRSSLYRLFKKELGISVTQYILGRRMDKAAYYLLNTRLSVSEIAYMAGFSDYAHFYRTFRKTFDFTPTEYRKRF